MQMTHTRPDFRFKSRILKVNESGGILAMSLQLREFVSFNGANGPDLPETITLALREYFGKEPLEPDHKYMLLGEYPFEADPSSRAPVETCLAQGVGTVRRQVRIDPDGSRFSEVIPHLINADRMKTSVFYRIETKDLEQTEKNNCSFYRIKGGNSFTIDLHSFLPNYDNFDEKMPNTRTIIAELSSSIITPSGPTQVVCSKYGRESFFFRKLRR